MLKFLNDLRRSYVVNRASVACWYYARRFRSEGRGGANGSALVQSIDQSAQCRVTLSNLPDLRQVISTFSRDNRWNHFKPSHPPGTIVDLGANHGLSALYWQMRYPEARVHGVEMDSDNVRIAQALSAENGLQIHFHHAAITSSDGPITYRAHACAERHRLDDLAANDQQYKYGSELRETSGVRLSSFIQQQNLGVVDLLKVDIEGAEQHLLEDIRGWAPLVRDLLLEVHHNIDTDWARNVLQGAGFDLTAGDGMNRTEWWCRRDTK